MHALILPRFRFVALVAVLAVSPPGRAAPAAPAAGVVTPGWAKVAIARAADGTPQVTLESDLLRLDYGPDVKPHEATVSKVLALVYRPTGQKLGPLDSRYSPSRTEFLTLREAEQIRPRSADEVTVRLYFLTRVLDITLTRGSPAVRFDYTFLNDSRHTYDQVNVSGGPACTYFYFGRAAYMKRMGWSGAAAQRQPEYAAYPFSFYRSGWAGGPDLDYKGWLVIGAGAPGQLGYGVLLPRAKLRWLKLMARTGGLERMMTGNATVYFYLVPDFTPERALQRGEALADTLK